MQLAKFENIKDCSRAVFSPLGERGNLFQMAGDEDVGDGPGGDVEEEEDGDVEVEAQPAIGEGEEEAYSYYDGHHYGAPQAEVEEFVVDVVLVGEEGAYVVAQAVEVDADHVKAWDQQRGEGYYGGVVALIHDAHAADADAECGEDYAYREGSGVAHEDLLVALGVAKDVEAEETKQGAAGAERYK